MDGLMSLLGLGRIVGARFSPVEDNVIYLSCYGTSGTGGITKCDYTAGNVLSQVSATGTFKLELSCKRP
ncbi:MAG: hypothetical protein R2764_16325 [Bacteroidales bacterium]